ncbi:uncharacterized protein [Dermacentor andersoni]|uniref:uncharacterized protein isoform X2 n=1 Tax=Dermacentor andersoni TaxID=34620 RepID=UPI002415FF1C|nr:uncharacterized protein LOC129380931 isoform X2 [Dermacentor andersoni]
MFGMRHGVFVIFCALALFVLCALLLQRANAKNGGNLTCPERPRYQNLTCTYIHHVSKRDITCRRPDNSLCTDPRVGARGGKPVQKSPGRKDQPPILDQTPWAAARGGKHVQTSPGRKDKPPIPDQTQCMSRDVDVSKIPSTILLGLFKGPRNALFE